jgi:hypothetical protein
MKYAVEIGSGGTSYKPRLINTGSDIKKLLRGYTHGHRDSKLNS